MFVSLYYSGRDIEHSEKSFNFTVNLYDDLFKFEFQLEFSGVIRMEIFENSFVLYTNDASSRLSLVDRVFQLIGGSISIAYDNVEYDRDDIKELGKALQEDNFPVIFHEPQIGPQTEERALGGGYLRGKKNRSPKSKSPKLTKRRSQKSKRKT
jgi:hypothetical protein